MKRFRTALQNYVKINKEVFRPTKLIPRSFRISPIMKQTEMSLPALYPLFRNLKLLRALISVLIYTKFCLITNS